MHEPGGGERKQNPHWGVSLRQGSISQPRDYDLSPWVETKNSMINRLSHPALSNVISVPSAEEWSGSLPLSLNLGWNCDCSRGYGFHPGVGLKRPFHSETCSAMGRANLSQPVCVWVGGLRLVNLPLPLPHHCWQLASYHPPLRALCRYMKGPSRGQLSLA